MTQTGFSNTQRAVLREADDFEFAVQVVVAGGGAAGQCAALAAADAGLDVWLIERDATPQGSTAMSEGAICAAGTKSQAENGVEDSPEHFFNDIMAKTEGRVDADFVRAIAEGSGPTVDWLVDKHGLPITWDEDWVAAYGHTAQRLHKTPSGVGDELIGALTAAAERAGVNLITEATLIHGYHDANGKVTGVCIERPSGEKEDIGCEALILATCGFGASPKMISENIPSMKDAFYWGHEGNDGIGIQVGQALGGATKYMDAYQGLGLLAKAYGEMVHPSAILAGGILVNLEGKRFEDEIIDVSGQGARILKQPEQTAWAVFNTHCFEISLRTPQMRNLNDMGGIKTAHTIAELAKTIGCSEDALARTIADTNALAASGKPDEYGRSFPPDAVLEPPFHAGKVTGALFHTQGGLMVDGNAQVLREDGTPIANLFAAGGTARSISGPGPTGYLPAAGLCMAVTLGRLAGETAAKEIQK